MTVFIQLIFRTLSVLPLPVLHAAGWLHGLGQLSLLSGRYRRRLLANARQAGLARAHRACVGRRVGQDAGRNAPHVAGQAHDQLRWEGDSGRGFCSDAWLRRAVPDAPSGLFRDHGPGLGTAFRRSHADHGAVSPFAPALAARSGGHRPRTPQSVHGAHHAGRRQTAHQGAQEPAGGGPAARPGAAGMGRASGHPFSAARPTP